MADDSAPALNQQVKEQTTDAKRSHEREMALMRILVLYGDKIYDEEEEQTVAEFVVENLIEDEYYFHNAQFKSVVETLSEKMSQEEEIEPDFFVKHPDFSQIAASFIAQLHQLSPVWAEKHEIIITDEDQNYREATLETINYIKLSHLERSIENNKQQLKEAENEEESILYLNIHAKLESIRKRLNEEIGIDGADK